MNNYNFTLTPVSGELDVQMSRNIKGDKGDPGNGIASIVQNPDYTLTITMDDGTTYTTDDVRGEPGAQGEPGAPGVGVPSGGTAGQVQTKTTDEDYETEWADPSGSVSSVNGKTGEVHLDAEDVGALPDNTEIPDEDTVAGWGFTKNTGDYSKPADGIPKDDLADAVQTSLEKADTAIQQHQDISGKSDKNNPVFTGNISLGRKTGTTAGANSVALGSNVEASGHYSAAFGLGTKATGLDAVAVGQNTEASGFASFAEGVGTNMYQDKITLLIHWTTLRHSCQTSSITPAIS